MAMASGYPAGALKNAFVYKNPDFANWILCDDFDSQVIVPPDTPGVNGSSLGTIWAALEDPGPKDTEGINQKKSFGRAYFKEVVPSLDSNCIKSELLISAFFNAAQLVIDD